MNGIKAIETQYKGYRFRSRLEARWAVFLDVLGVKWEYEKEGFELEAGLRYLPDFWFPDLQKWGEVKPHGFSDTERHKAGLLARESGHPVIAMIGNPGDQVDYMEYRWAPYVYMNDGELIEHCIGLFPAHEFCALDDSARDAARGARFEFGEIPIVPIPAPSSDVVPFDSPELPAGEFNPSAVMLIVVRRTGNPQQDLARMEAVYQTLLDYAGNTSFSICMRGVGRKDVTIDFVNEGTRDCPEMRAKITCILGAGCIEVKR